jgi:hypothetical protein
MSPIEALALPRSEWQVGAEEHMNLRNFARRNPFLVVGLIGWAMLAIGAPPAGADYDPNPVRQILYLLCPFPGLFFAVGYGIAAAIGIPEGRWLAVAMMSIGFALYALADLAYRAWRRHRSSRITPSSSAARRSP